MIGRGVAGSGEGERAIAVSAAKDTLVIAGMSPVDVGGVAVGSIRTVLGMSARGANSAIRTSISRRLLSLAFARTDWWFSAVRCGAGRRAEAVRRMLFCMSPVYHDEFRASGEALNGPGAPFDGRFIAREDSGPEAAGRGEE
jgi:hypothetical protein